MLNSSAARWVIALFFFAIALGDTATGFQLPAQGVALLAALSALSLGFFLARLRGASVPAALLAGAFLASASRLIGYDLPRNRPPADWATRRRESADSKVIELTRRFDDLCTQTVAAARALAADPRIASAVGESNHREALRGAFDRLDAVARPETLPEVASGITLYDGWLRPLAWTGKNVDLSYAGLSLDRAVFILEQGVFTYLIAIEPLAPAPGVEGAIAVEVPLAARRHVDNRYLSDFDVVTRWAGGSNVQIDYVDFREKAPELASLFERSGDHYLGGTEARPVHYFPLRSGSAILGVVSLAEEAREGLLLERKERIERLAGLVLMASFLPVVLLSARSFRSQASRARLGHSAWALRALGFTLALWSLRFGLRLVRLPLGLGTSVEDPSYYASNAFFDLFSSPIDFLATSVAVTLSILALCLPALVGLSVPRARRAVFKLASFAIGAVALYLVRELVRDTWSNANLHLARTGVLPWDPPRLAVQLGLYGFFVSACVVVLWLHVAFPTPSTATRTLGRIYFFLALGCGVLAFFRPDPAFIALCSALALLIGLELLARHLPTLVDRFRRGGLYFRIGLTYVLLSMPAVGFYPMLAAYEESTLRHFIEKNVASTVLHQEDSQEYVLRGALQAIDRMEQDGQLGSPERGDLAYRIWSGSGLSTSALSAAVDVYRDGKAFARFALNSEAFAGAAPGDGSNFEPTWTLEEEAYPSQPSRPRVLRARRALGGDVFSDGGVEVRVAADWSSLPFITARDPYIDLFRARGNDVPLPLAGRQVSLHVFDLQGNALFRSSNDLIVLSPDDVAEALKAPHWTDRRASGRTYGDYLFSGKGFLFALSYPSETLVDLAGELTGWTLLTGLGTVFLLGSAILASAFGAARGVRARELWGEVGSSFYNKLFVAFVAVALVPIVSLAVLVRGIMIQRLQYHVEQEGMTRAQVVERYVHDYLVRERIEANERGVAAVTDEILQWIGGLVEADVDLYSRGDLVATSKRALFASGLLPTRAVPAVYREVVVNRADHSIHWEAVGDFRYLVVSVPISLERWREPGIVSIPLASRQREINQEVASLNQTVLLAAICFSLAAAALAYSLARRMAEPINKLTAATRRIAQGDFDVRLETEARDEIGALYNGFNQMASDLKREREQAEHASKLEAWAEMARQVAHEVKNPLTPIQLSAEHLRRVYHDKTVDFAAVLKTCTDTILQQVRTLRQITLEFSTFASPKPLARQPTDLGRLLSDTLAPYRRSVPPGVSLELQVGPALPEVDVDRKLMERTVVNLVENALQALTGRGGEVVVRAGALELNGHKEVEVTVTDNGAGIDPDALEHVFEPYFSTRAAGTGLGLAIARKTVEEHGGAISLESETGKGTVVRLRLPAS